MGDTRDSDFSIRTARTTDGDMMLPLSVQLGYPTALDSFELRLREILERPDHAVWVAQNRDGHVVGWVHVYLRNLLVTDSHAALGGIVVHGDLLRLGIGRQLLQTAEDWARERKSSVLWVNTNVIREGAQDFYLSLEYSLQKTQNVYVKHLA